MQHLHYLLTNIHSLSFTVLAEMDRIGCDMFMDIHGDELLPYNFILGSEAVPQWGPRLQALQQSFCEEFQKVR